MMVILKFQWNVNTTIEPSNMCETLNSISASFAVFFDLLWWILQDGTSEDINECHLVVFP